jgi:phosphoribosylformylglycinamidine (FGAM) synthase-like enzyme
MPNSAAEIKEAVLKIISAPNIADKSWVTNQYESLRIR